MPRHLLRPAYGLARAEFHRTLDTFPTITRPFTTSPARPADSNSNHDDKTPLHETRRSEVRNLFAEERARRPPRQPNSEGATTKPVAPAGAAPQGAKVINLKSLPRGFRDRLRGGGAAAQSRGESTPGAAAASGRTSGDGVDDGPSWRTGGVRGGRGGRGAGMKRGRRAPTGKAATKEEVEEEAEFRAQHEAHGEEKKFDITEFPEDRRERFRLEVGENTPYNPNTSLETLVPFLPEVATSSSPLGRFGTVVRNLKVLAGGIIDQNPIINSEEMYKDYKRKGAIFYAEPKTKGRIEWDLPPGKDIEPVMDEVKEVILGRAIRGEYDEVKPVDYRDVVALTRRYHVKEGTYLRSDTDKFEAKLTELLSKAGRPAGSAAKAKEA